MSELDGSPADKLTLLSLLIGSRDYGLDKSSRRNGRIEDFMDIAL
ncbi:hypothetical protein [Methylobacterium sp.]|nr:hypothetical protein [Methylobacterium sp.]